MAGPYRQLWDTSLDALARHLDVLAAADDNPTPTDAETARSDDDE